MDVVLRWKSENLTKLTPNNMPRLPFDALEVDMDKASGLKKYLGSGEIVFGSVWWMETVSDFEGT